MTEPPPPRVTVTLPAGGRLPAQLLRWRQDQTGAWWAEIAFDAPAEAVAPIDGEDYSRLPREATGPPEG